MYIEDKSERELVKNKKASEQIKRDELNNRKTSKIRFNTAG